MTLLRETYNDDERLKITSVEDTECNMNAVKEVSMDVTRNALSTEMQGDIKETLAVIIGTLSFSEFSQIVYNLVDRLVSSISNQF